MQRMLTAQFVIAVRQECQHRQRRDAPPQEREQIEGGFIGPMHILNDYHRWAAPLLQLVQKGGKQEGTRGLLTQEGG